jgi:hypothetical protein
MVKYFKLLVVALATCASMLPDFVGAEGAAAATSLDGESNAMYAGLTNAGRFLLARRIGPKKEFHWSRKDMPMPAPAPVETLSEKMDTAVAPAPTTDVEGENSADDGACSSILDLAKGAGDLTSLVTALEVCASHF